MSRRSQCGPYNSKLQVLLIRHTGRIHSLGSSCHGSLQAAVNPHTNAKTLRAPKTPRSSPRKSLETQRPRSPKAPRTSALTWSCKNLCSGSRKPCTCAPLRNPKKDLSSNDAARNFYNRGWVFKLRALLAAINSRKPILASENPKEP